MGNFQEGVTFLWNLTNLLRNYYKRSRYQDVILPFTTLKRLNDVLKYSKEDIIKFYDVDHEKIDKLFTIAKDTEGNELGYFNYSKHDFKSLLEDPEHIEENLMHYIDCFSPNVKDIFDNFQIQNQIKYLSSRNLLYPFIEKLYEIDLGSTIYSNAEMGDIYEELIRKFIENSEKAGEYSTPPDVLNLMTKLLFIENEDRLRENNSLVKIYDPACGIGGLLTCCKDFINSINPSTNVELFGQEINETTYAVCKSKMLIKGDNAESIKGPFSTLSKDQLPNEKFHYMISNPPYGRKWEQDKEVVLKEAEKGFNGRFGAGTPRINDGQLLFIQHMLSKMKDEEKSRIAVITNRSPLVSGNAGSGESNIRKWIIENDYLETIIALPEQLFYNTSIMNYIWILTNKKSPERMEKVQLIDSVSNYKKIRKNLGSKSNYISDVNLEDIISSYVNFEENENSRIFDNEEFCYTKVRIEFEDNPDENDKKSWFFENIPFKQNIEKYFENEILNSFPNAQMDETKNKIGYEINFVEVFYRYIPPISIAKEIPLKQLSKIANFRNVEEKEDILVIPAAISKDVIFKPEFDPDGRLKNSRAYIECEVKNRDKVLPQYLKIFLNSELGKYQRRLFSRSFIHGVIVDNLIKSIYVAIPDLETQKNIIDADQKITEWYNETVSLYERFNNKIFNYEDVLGIISSLQIKETNIGEVKESDQTNELDKVKVSKTDKPVQVKVSDQVEESSENQIQIYQKRNPLYDDILWPLATLYISATRGSSEPVETALNYFNLFEFIAAFNSIVLISALPDKIYQENKDNIWKNYNDFYKVSFGNWVGLYRRLSEIVRKEELDQPFGSDFYKKISSPKMTKILNPIPEKRNKNLHGNTLPPIIAENIVLELKPYLKDVFQILMSYNKLKLIYIESIDDIETIENNQLIYKMKVKRLNGACYPFIYEYIKTSKHMDRKSIYLYNPTTEERLKLKGDLIKLIQCKECTLWSLYIYNKINKTKKRSTAIYKSYQTEQHDHLVEDINLYDLLDLKD